jgi:hypothetical protein
MALNLRTYENQAKASVYLGLLAALAALVVIALIAWKFDRTSFYVTFNARGLYLPLIGLGLIVGGGAGTAGFFIGLSSAGQRRNTLSGLSWKGFFLNALVLTIVLAAAIFFYFTRNALVPKPRTAAAGSAAAPIVAVASLPPAAPRA